MRRVCDEVAVLDGGRVLERGTVLQLIQDPNSHAARTLLPAIQEAPTLGRHDRVADVLLIGYASVGALLPEAGSRYGVEIAVLGGGLTRIGEVPVARLRVGVTGAGAETALSWLAERGAAVHHRSATGRAVAAA